MSDESGHVWSLATCRAAYGRLQAAYRELTGDLATTGGELARTTYQLELERKRSAMVQRELDAAHRRERVLIAELAACKRQGESGHTTRPVGNVTPILPPPKKK